MYKKKKRGQSMVEFAMLAPFMFLILATIIEGSPLINAYIKIEKATETGARIAAVYGNTDNDVLDGILLQLHQMSNRTQYVAYQPGTEDTGGRSTVGFYVDPTCTSADAPSDLPYTDYTKELYVNGNTLCPSIAYENSGYGPLRTTVIIYPALRYRINGSWTTVSILYNYRVFTPVLFTAADILSAGETVVSAPYYKTIPIYRFSTKKIE